MSANPYSLLNVAQQAGGVGFLQSGQFGSASSASDPSLTSALGVLKQYDPSASIGSVVSPTDGSTSYQVKFDGSKIPQPKSGMVQDFNLDNGNASQHVAGQASTLNSLQGATQDPTLGWMVPQTNVGQISEQENDAEQNNGGFLDKATGMLPKNGLQAITDIAMMGLAGPLASAAGGGLAGQAADAGLNLAGGAIDTGGKSLENPDSYLGAGLSLGGSALGGALPPDVANILKWAQMGYGAIKNPIGTGINAGLGFGKSLLGNG